MRKQQKRLCVVSEKQGWKQGCTQYLNVTNFLILVSLPVIQGLSLFGFSEEMTRMQKRLCVVSEKQAWKQGCTQYLNVTNFLILVSLPVIQGLSLFGFSEEMTRDWGDRKLAVCGRRNRAWTFLVLVQVAKRKNIWEGKTKLLPFDFSLSRRYAEKTPPKKTGVYK